MSSSLSHRQTSFSGKSLPRKPKNSEVRPREYLTDDEVRRLIQAARRSGRYGQRDATLILMTYRHGLRVSNTRSGIQSCRRSAFVASGRTNSGRRKNREKVFRAVKSLLRSGAYSE